MTTLLLRCSSRSSPNRTLVGRAALAAAALLLCTLVSPVAGWAAGPDWVNSGKSRRHPASQFIIGVGSGDTRNDAVDRARAEIAAQFEVRVESATSVAVSSRHETGPSGERLSLTEDVENVTRTSTAKTMRGVTISETWLDPSTATHHALAVLERASVVRALLSRVADSDKTMAQAMKEAQATTSDLAALRAWIRALEAYERRSVLHAQVGVVDRGAWAKAATKVSRQRLQAQVRTRLGTLDASVSVTPPKSPSSAKLAHGLQRAIADFGLKVRKGKASTALRIEVVLDEGAEPPSNPRFRFWRIEARVQVQERAGTATIGATTLTAREGALSVADARNRAQMRITDDVVQNFVDHLRRLVAGGTAN